jgi:hypothetical protein
MAILIGSHIHSDLVLADVIEIVEGELVDGFRPCVHCGGRHPIIDGRIESCCCGLQDHEIEYCCGEGCGHYHDGGVCPGRHCDDYRCCQP